MQTPCIDARRFFLPDRHASEIWLPSCFQETWLNRRKLNRDRWGGDFDSLRSPDRPGLLHVCAYASMYLCVHTGLHVAANLEQALAAWSVLRDTIRVHAAYNSCLVLNRII